MANQKKLTRADKEKQPLSSDLKMRVLRAKKELPSHGLTALFFHYFKDFNDTVKNKSKLNNVLQTRQTDEAITEKLEKLVELFKNKHE
ncbi:MAG: hypothetical protein GY834_07905 [Bacteroidetes bacterium]|nr:hypothetical protein [Bacteroidota bacterium]